MSNIAELADRIDLEALAVRCEQAVEPCRSIDYDIAHLVTRSHMENGKAPAYTASLDAVLTLVPAGCSWEVKATGEALVYDDQSQDGSGYMEFLGDAATPALALAAAALKARAHAATKGATDDR